MSYRTLPFISYSFVASFFSFLFLLLLLLMVLVAMFGSCIVCKMGACYTIIIVLNITLQCDGQQVYVNSIWMMFCTSTKWKIEHSQRSTFRPIFEAFQAIQVAICQVKCGCGLAIDKSISRKNSPQPSTQQLSRRCRKSQKSKNSSIFDKILQSEICRFASSIVRICWGFQFSWQKQTTSWVQWHRNWNRCDANLKTFPSDFRFWNSLFRF